MVRNAACGGLAHTLMIKLRERAFAAALIMAVAVVSIAVSLLVTPLQQQTSAAGQTIHVGVAAPTWDLSGPGELDLFGQRIPTTVQFIGPVRPRVQLSQITLSQQLSDFVKTAGNSGTSQVESALVRGWWHYFAWQLVLVAATALILSGAVAGWRRRGRRATIGFIAVALVVSLAVNVGAIMTTAFTTPQRLSRVTSLEALVGASPLPPAATTSIRSSASGTTMHVVVIGDSTAAAIGNPLVARPGMIDKACGRSRDSFAADLAGVNGWKVTNLACSGATIADGLLGPQSTRGLSVPGQLGDPAIANASTILVSIGANDVHWSNMLEVCAASPTCQDDVEEAYFQQQLAGFSRDYLQLLTQLKALPTHPQIVVNLYYNPFVDDDNCLASAGISAAKQQSMTAKLDALNDILAAGAQAASFDIAHPDFTGHGLCSDSPYVQAPHANAPFHPIPAGELAIALVDAEAATGTH